MNSNLGRGFELHRSLQNNTSCSCLSAATSLEKPYKTRVGDLALRAGSVERTGARAVAESLSAVTALARVPVIDDHLHRHLASPNAVAALLLVGSCRQSPVTALAVDRKRRWNTTPRWRCLFHNL